MRKPTLSRRRAFVAAVAATLAGVAGAALSAPPNAAPTTASKLQDKAVAKKWRVLDAKGRTKGTALWRVTKAGGNCCEVLVAVTDTGRIVEFGGTYPAYSDDRGKSWTEIAPLAPSTSRLPNPGPRKLGGGEGTVVMAPTGDIIGVGWDPYSGDRLQSFLYENKTGKWFYGESPIHEPFYDREWVAVAKGPFTIRGQEVPWVSLVVSGFHRRLMMLSTDGINYVTPTQNDIDSMRNPAVKSYLPVVKDAQLDFLQPHTETRIVPLAGGGALSIDAAQACKYQRLNGDGSWSCFAFPNGFDEIDGVESRLLVDSRGWLHVVRAEGTEFTYFLSRDGGRKWTQRLLTLPGEPQIESWDFKVNGKLGLTAIAAHAKKDNGFFQDMVVRVDTKKGTPVHRDTLLVGDGNRAFTSGLNVQDAISGAPSYRYDFATVAILPDGKIVAGFADKTYDDPALAILA